MTELSKDNDQESSYKEAFRSQITLPHKESANFHIIQSHITNADD